MSALLTVALKGLVVLAAAALGARALRGASAATRHGVWAVAFAALALLPVLEMAGPRWAVGVLPAREAVSVGSAVAPPPPPPVPPAPPPPPPAPPTPPAPPAFGDAPSAHGPDLAAFERHTESFDHDTESFDHDMESLSHDMEAFDREMDAFDRQMEAFDAQLDRSEALALPAGGGGLASRLAQTASRSGRWLVALWAVGALVVALGWLAAVLAARRVVAEAAPETDDEWAVQAERARRLTGLSAPVRLLRSSALDVPVAWGWGRGAVVLPADADAWDEDRREAVLLHEMAHLARRDAWSQAVAQVALTVHWANPLAWWGYRRFLDAREHACDDAVLRSGARPSAYAAHLVGVARAVRRNRWALAAVAPMARTAPIESRVTSILDPVRRRRPLGRRAVLGGAALAVAVCVPLAAVQPVAQTQSPAPFAAADTLDSLRADAQPRPDSFWSDSLWADSLDSWDEIDQATERALDGDDTEDALVGDDTERTTGGWGGETEDDIADIEDALDEADEEIEDALDDIREQIEEVRQEGGPGAALRLRALREAANGLAQIDRQSLRENARAEALRALRQPLPPVPPTPPAVAPAPPVPPAVNWSDVDQARAAALARSSTSR